MVCEHCGKPVAPADRYCAACLTPRTPSPPPLATSPVQAAQPVPQPTSWSAPAPTWGAPPPPPSPPAVPAGFWLRLAALLIDDLVIGLTMGILVMVVGVVVALASVTQGDARSPLAGALMVVGWLVMMAGPWAYFAVMESSTHQATLGKLALGLVVTDLQGQRLGLGRATGRHFGKFLSAIPIYLGFVMAAFTRRKQALHDLMAGTLVMRRGPLKAPAVVIAVVAGGFGMVALLGILAAIAIPNFIRYQLRSKDAEAPVMLRALHEAELVHRGAQGRFLELAVPGGVPGQARRAWSAADRANADRLGWSAQGPSYFIYRVAVEQTEDGQQAFATCAEADLDGDGKVAAWVTWQPVELPGGRLVAPVPPCAHSPALDRPLELQPGDPIGKPVRVSPTSVF